MLQFRHVKVYISCSLNNYFPLLLMVCVDAGAGLVQSLGPVALLPLGRPGPFFSVAAGAGSLMVVRDGSGG